MSLHAISVNVTLETLECAKCATTFAIPANLLARLRKNADTFYCPLGHTNWYGKSEAERLKEKLDEQTRVATREAQRAADAERAEQAAVKEKNKLARELKAINKRVHAGVCTCCNRTFQNLARHMATKHKQGE